MMDLPVTLPLSVMRQRRWTLCTHYGAFLTDYSKESAIVLQLEVLPAEVRALAAHLGRTLGPAALLNENVLDSTPAAEPTEQHGVWQVVDRHGKVLADCPSHSEACKISGQLDLPNGDDSPHSVYFAMVPV